MFTAIRRQQRSNGLAMAARREFADNVRKAALIRATYRCERCGRRGFLELHHCGNRADNSLFNCEVLCLDCHSREHQRRAARQCVGYRKYCPRCAGKSFVWNGVCERGHRFV
jgi:hypothetical protein